MIAATCSRTATHRTAVVFAADGLYERFALLAAQRLRALQPGAFDIVLAGIDPPRPVPASLAGLDVRLAHVRTGALFDPLRLDANHSAVIYLRLALPEALAGDYDRILYLDSDVLIERGDFAALLSADMHGHALGAVRNHGQWRTPGRRNDQFRRLGLPASPYFNSGALLIDVAAWRAAQVMERSVAFGAAHRGDMIRHDQNLLNAVLQGDWAEMHPAWNWQYTRASGFFAEMMDPAVLHFIGGAKPWKVDDGRFPLRYRRAFVDFLAAHWPGEPAPAPPRTAPQDAPREMRHALWRHLLSSDRFARYVAACGDPGTLRARAEVPA